MTQTTVDRRISCSSLNRYSDSICHPRSVARSRFFVSFLLPTSYHCINLKDKPNANYKATTSSYEIFIVYVHVYFFKEEILLAYLNLKKIQRINAYKVFHISSNRFVSHCIVSSMINSHVYCWMNNDIECYYSNIDFVNLWPLFSSVESKQHQELLFFENCKYKKYVSWIGWHSWTWNPTDAAMCGK